MSLPAPIVLGLLLVLNGQVREQPATRDPLGRSGGRHFTVRDSIEMARFERSGGEPKFSPDKKYFAVVTSRGVIQSNEIESTLWMFQSGDVSELLRASSVAKQSLPKVLARVVAVPQLEYSDSYEALITGLRWTPDSKSILFLGQNAQGKRQLRQADVHSGLVRTLTPEDYDVTRFEFAGSNIAYVAVPPGASGSPGEPINSDAWDVTGASLTSILFPVMAYHQKLSELWVGGKGKNRRMTDPNTGQPVRLPKLPPLPYSVLSLSSDGEAVVVLVPSKTIPLSWELYESVFAYLRLQSKETDASADFWPTQYAAIDLNSGKTTVLVNAPNAWALGSADMNQAAWSFDGKKLLLTNTYLSLEGVDAPERSKRLHHCAAAIVELASKASSCVVFSTYARAKKYLIAASFGESDTEVVLRFWNARDRTTQERYLYRNGAWQRIDPPTNQEHQALGPLDHKVDSATLSVAIKQDLNTPPALWATDRETGRSKKIWDPNPQLAEFNLGEVSEIHWKDNTGYEWVGVLVKPVNYVPGRRYPLVIQTHGFQSGEFMTDGAFTTAFAARPLAGAGIVVLQMPTRHDRFVTKDEAADQVEGFESAIERLASDGLIDS